MGGNFRTVIVNSSLATPSGLTLDYEDRMLYWADITLYVFLIYNALQQILYCSHFLTTPLLPLRDQIERATLNGENRQVILQGLPYPFSLTVFQQDVFWTDWTEKSIFRAGKDDGSDVTVLARDLEHRPNDIHVFAASRQEECTSHCLQFNGGCSHICVSGKSRLLLVDDIE